MKMLIMTLFLVCTLSWCSLGLCSEINQAALKGDLEAVKTLLKANPNLVFSKDTNYFGYTPLHAAAEKGHKEVAELLLTNKADVHAKCDNGWTPLHAAAYHGHEDVVVLLVANKADVNAKDYDGYTPLHMAAMGHKDIAAYLLTHKADVNAKGIKGDTPLHLAVLTKHNDVIELLRQNGGHE
jgi:ankyrin repeat protein